MDPGRNALCGLCMAVDVRVWSSGAIRLSSFALCHVTGCGPVTCEVDRAFDSVVRCAAVNLCLWS